jgi:hypothetical protein
VRRRHSIFIANRKKAWADTGLSARRTRKLAWHRSFLQATRRAGAQSHQKLPFNGLLPGVEFNPA